MCIHFFVAVTLFISMLAAQPEIKSPQKFTIIQVDGYSHITRSADGQYRSFNELPKSVRDEFLQSSVSQSQMKSSITKMSSAMVTFVVSNAGDDADFDIDDGVYSPATLRSAIQNANKLGGSHAIAFASGISVITPATQLPTVTVTLNIDGTVAAGKVILDGSASTGTYGLTLAGTSVVKNMIFKSWKSVGLGLASGAVNSTIQRNEFTLNKIGLNVNAAGTLIGGDLPDVRNFAHGNTQDGIDIVFANDNSIIDNFCGTKDGFTASPNTYSGIYVLGERNKVLKNLISGNNDSGLEIGEFSKKTLVQGNYIGLDNLGIGKLPNMYDGISTFADNDSIIDNYISGNGYGITVLGQSSQAYIGTNLIGSNVTLDSLFGNRFGGMQILGTQVVIEYNTVSCNTGSGIHITGNGGVVVKRNYIGVDPTGTLDWGNSGSGINILCDNNVIGGPDQNDGNIISGNGNYGIEMFGGFTIFFPGGSKPNYVQGNVIENNYIGTNKTGMTRIPNHSGISMQGNVDSNFVRKNLLSGNQHYGIFLQPFGAGPTRNVFSNNFIGTNIFGSQSLSNNDRGIYILAGSDNIFGGSAFIDKNLISGNIGQGILISGPSSGNTIKYNLIGTDWTGYYSLPNTTDGVLIDQSASNNVIQRNFISGNGRNGVTVETNSNLTPNGNVIIANTIGLDITNSLKLPNTDNGVFINNARNTRIGGAGSDSGNIISGNIGNGVYVFGDMSRGNLIRGNTIGTDGFGDKAIPNYRGILISYSNRNTIGGVEDWAYNLVSGNLYGGIYLYGSDSNSVYGNVIGLDILQTKIIANGDNGVAVDSSDYNIIGGDQAGGGNTISGNKLAGIILANSSTGNKIYNNGIGTDYTLTKKFGNEEDGIQIYSGANRTTIGKAGAENIITSNKYSGVIVGDSNQNRISANSIYDNGELGIDLYSGFFGVTPNDETDSDAGANDLQNFPVITFADGPFPFRVLGMMFGKPNETYTLEFFDAGVSDSTKYGEGKKFLISTTIGTDSTGFASINEALIIPVASGTFISATATDNNGNTSEFSKCIEVKVSNVVADIAVTVKANADTLKKTDTLVYLITLQNNGPDSAKQVTLKDTLSKHLTFIADSSSKGSILFADGILTVTVGLMEPGEKVNVVLVAKVDSIGSILNKAYASALTFDFDLLNNHAVDTALVPNVLAVGSETNEIPETYLLQQNYPNPFNPSTTIKFGLPVTSWVTLRVYDMLGREVATLINEERKAGLHSIRFDGSSFSTGVYIYALRTGNFVASKKLLLMK
ncbi:MAG: right-handed parallel beta-helix repeat-containing protein [Bacteroidota bacterium]|nr:right-handed parallel beta-helix repeat-containing protein [Bacteroidota bacterium]